MHAECRGSSVVIVQASREVNPFEMELAPDLQEPEAFRLCVPEPKRIRVPCNWLRVDDACQVNSLNCRQVVDGLAAMRDYSFFSIQERALCFFRLKGAVFSIGQLQDRLWRMVGNTVVEISSRTGVFQV
jgi:hypothetical protein